MHLKPLSAIVTAIVVLASVAAVLFVSVAQGGARLASVTVNLGSTRQVIQGFGTSQRPWAEPHISKASTNTVVPAGAQAQILSALYGRLGLTRVRDSLNSGIANSPGGPYNFSATFVDAQAAFVKQAKRYGLRTFFPAPVYLEDWMQAGDPAAYVDYAMAVLQRFKQDGAEPPFYSLINEPQISHDFPPQWMHDVVLQLGRRLRADGFKTKLVIPDDENPTDAYRRAVAVLQDPRTRPYVGALAYHIYKNFGDIGRMRQLASQYRLPLWMTEFESTGYTDWNSSLDWGVKMHTLLTQGGVNAIDYLWGFFGDWVKTDTMLAIAFDGSQYRSYSPTPIYWITGQYSRFVRPGYMRVAAESPPQLLVSAYKGPERAVIVAINPSASAQTMKVKVIGGKLKGVVRPVQSSASEHWRSLAPIVPRGGVFAATVPPQSITTYVAAR